MASAACPVVGTGAEPVYETDENGVQVLRRPNGQITTNPALGRRTVITPGDPFRPEVADWLKANRHSYSATMPIAGTSGWCLVTVTDEVLASIKGVGNVDLVDLAESGALERLLAERLIADDGDRAPLASRVNKTLLDAQREYEESRER